MNKFARLYAQTYLSYLDIRRATLAGFPCPAIYQLAWKLGRKMETVCVYVTAISCFPLGGNGKNHAGLHLRNRVQRGDTLYAGML